MTKHTVIVDGATIEVGSAEDVQKITAWLDQVANDNKAQVDRRAARDAQLADRDRQIADRQGQIDQLLQQDRETRQSIVELGDLKYVCQSRLKVDPVGRTMVDMKSDALSKKIGAQSVAGKDDAYVAARFDMVLDSAAMAAPHTDPFRSAMMDGIGKPQPGTKEAADRAYDEMVADMVSAHRRTDN